MGPGDDSAVLARVQAHLVGAFGPTTGRAGVTFLGTDPMEVLRFGPAPVGIVRYVTLGMAREPMDDPTAAVRDPLGPRAELVLSLRAARDSVARRLAVLAAIPIVEGVPVVAGAGLDLGEPLWDGARFHGVLVGESGGLVEDLPLAPAGTVGSTVSAGGSAEASAGASAGAVAGTGAPTEAQPVRFLPVFPMTPNESAFKRVHGASALRERWLADGVDLRDPDRREVRLS